MKNKFMGVLAMVLVAGFIYWLFLFVTYSLTCMSLERFDNAKTRMVFPFWCEASIDGQEYRRIVW